MTARVVEFFEIVCPRCANTYGVAPCTASIPTTGDAKCFNCLATCQDTDNFVDTTATLRFAKPADYLTETGIDIVGSWVRSIEHSSATISLAENRGTRAVLTVTIEDRPHSDAGEGLDDYQADRGYNPYERGSFWPRLCARYPSFVGFKCYWYIGEVGQSLEEMERRTFYIEGLKPPGRDGSVVITAKDVMKFQDSDRAQIPVLSEGSLQANITNSDTSFTLVPSGIGSTYPNAGYFNLAGSEVVYGEHDPTAGNDANCLLLLHCEGVSTTFTDSSSSARTMTANGNAQQDTAQHFFGTKSAAFDGVGDFISTPDAAAFTFAGDFTLECRVRLFSLATNRIFISHSTDANNGWRFGVGATGDLFFNHVVSSVLTLSVNGPVGQLTTGVWYHVALVRHGNVWKIYLDGVAVATVTQSLTLTNFTSTLKVGIGMDASTWGMHGWMDEIRVSNVARWTDGFNLLYATGPYSSSSDTVSNVVRGALNTTAASHTAGDRVQLVKRFTAMAMADILNDAISNYTDTPAGYIPLAEWQLEDATNLGTLYSFDLVEPVGVGDFVSRGLEQCGSAMWDDPLAEQLRFKVIKPVPTSADVISEANVIGQTFELTDQPEQRVSRVQVYFAPRDPTKRRDDLSNYRQSSKRPDAETADENEALYGSPSIKTILADGIGIGGSSVADRVGNLVVGRKQRAPRRFKFSKLRTEANLPKLGDAGFIDWRSLQDASGAREMVPVQVISCKVTATQNQYTAEEMRFTDLDTGSSLDRVFLINFNGSNLDLRSIHDLSYPSTFAGVTVTFIISALIGSNSTSALGAVTIGDWPVGFVPKIILSGRIQGMGGNGANSSFGSKNGSPGGVALYTRHEVDLDISAGEIWSGGGGGGAARSGVAAAGGGGAGSNPGIAGPQAPGAATPPADGTATAGGAGAQGAPGHGGAGGGPGLSGSSAVDFLLPPGTGGAAGAAIDGVSFVNVIAGPGDIRGSQIN